MKFPNVNKLTTSYNKLCTPAMLYFTISILSLIVVLFQNLGHTKSFHIGSFSARVPNTALVFIIKLMYILFWTWILDLICKDKHTNVAWLLVLLPYVVLALIIGLVAINK